MLVQPPWRWTLNARLRRLAMVRGRCPARNRAAGMREYAAAHNWLTIVHLPSYAPDLNPVEGVWSLGDGHAEADGRVRTLANEQIHKRGFRLDGGWDDVDACTLRSAVDVTRE